MEKLLILQVYRHLLKGRSVKFRRYLLFSHIK